MKSYPTRKLIRLGTIAITALMMSAELQAQESSDEPKGRKAWILAPYLPEGIDNPMTFISAGKIHTVRIHSRSMGEAMPVDQDGIVRAVKLTPNPNGKPVVENLSLVKIPQQTRECLIVLLPSADKESKLAFDSTVLDLSKFKNGGFLYVNLTTAKLGIEVGEQKMTLKPGGIDFLNALEKQETAIQKIAYYYEDPNDEKWKMMASSKVAAYGTRREICVFFYNERMGALDYRGLSFVQPPNERAAAQP